MKNAFKILGIAAIAAFVLVSCGKSSTPKETVDSFFSALQGKKYDDALKLTTGDGTETVGLVKGFASDSTFKVEAKAGEPVVVGDSVATFKYTIGGAEKSGSLKKVDGKWLVSAISIEDLVGSAGEMVETPIETTTPEDTSKAPKAAEAAVKK